MLQLLSNPSAIRSLSHRCSAPGCTQGQEQGELHCAIAVCTQSDFAAGGASNLPGHTQLEADTPEDLSMTPGEALISVWQQSLADSQEEVELGQESYPVKVFRAKKLRNVEFSYGDLRIIGIEQNPAASSRWAALAQEGKRIMQFRCNGRYIANVCEGKLLRYPAWTALTLPD